MRNNIRQRDEYLCRICYERGAYVSRDLSVHHIVPLEIDYSRRLKEDNLITLCGVHHREADDGIISAAELLAAIPPGV